MTLLFHPRPLPPPRLFAATRTWCFMLLIAILSTTTALVSGAADALVQEEQHQQAQHHDDPQHGADADDSQKEQQHKQQVYDYSLSDELVGENEGNGDDEDEVAAAEVVIIDEGKQGDNDEDDIIVFVPEERAMIWKATLEACSRAKRDGINEWKQVGEEAGAQVYRQLERKKEVQRDEYMRARKQRQRE